MSREGQVAAHSTPDQDGDSLLSKCSRRRLSLSKEGVGMG